MLWGLSLSDLTFPVVEIFGPVIQGEGIMCGVQTVFVRLGGCDYRCTWCDSLHAVLPELVKKNSTRMTATEIVNEIRQGLKTDAHRCKWITISGGNPAIHRHLPTLISELHGYGYRVAVETQGTIWDRRVNNADIVTISPKPPSSGNATPIDQVFLAGVRSVIEDQFLGDYSQAAVCLKIVVFDRADYEYALEAFEKVRQEFGRHSVFSKQLSYYLQPGTPPDVFTSLTEVRQQILDNTRQITEWLLLELGGYDYVRIIPQMHALMYGHEQKR